MPLSVYPSGVYVFKKKKKKNPEVKNVNIDFLRRLRRRSFIILNLNFM